MNIIEEISLDINNIEREETKTFIYFSNCFNNVAIRSEEIIGEKLYHSFDEKGNLSTSCIELSAMIIHLNKKLYELLFMEFEETQKDLSRVLNGLKKYSEYFLNFIEINEESKEKEVTKSNEAIIKEGFEVCYDCIPELKNMVN